MWPTRNHGRIGPTIVLATALGVLAGACNGDDSSSSSTQSPFPPSACGPEPCTAGAVCSAQAEPACDGTWYCWKDKNWHCAPPDSGGPGGAPPDASMGDDGPNESAPAESGSGG